MQRSRDNGGDGHAAARKGEHNRLAVFITFQRLGEAAPGLRSIMKRHCFLHDFGRINRFSDTLYI